MTLLQEIENLTWHNAINKLKSILKRLLTSSDSNALPYKVYSAILVQTGTDAPVATVLENTLGTNVVWSRSGAGNYIATNSLFSSVNTIGFAGGHNGSNIVVVDCVNVSAGEALLWQYQPETSSDVDNFEGQIRIEVYN